MWGSLPLVSRRLFFFFFPAPWYVWVIGLPGNSRVGLTTSPVIKKSQVGRLVGSVG